jgi:hypothetical protein
MSTLNLPAVHITQQQQWQQQQQQRQQQRQQQQSDVWPSCQRP